jgi:hypothetical protein
LSRFYETDFVLEKLRFYAKKYYKTIRDPFIKNNKCKGKSHPRTGHEGPEGVG